MFRAVVVLLLLLNCSQLLADNPRGVVNEYFEILESREFERLDKLLVPTDLELVKTMFEDRFEKDQRIGSQALQVKMFGRELSKEDLAGMSPRDYLNVLSKEIFVAADSSSLQIKSKKVVGQVRENRNLVHVLVRLHFDLSGEDNSEIYVYSLQRVDGSWKLEMPPTLMSILALLQQGF